MAYSHHPRFQQLQTEVKTFVRDPDALPTLARTLQPRLQQLQLWVVLPEQSEEAHQSLLTFLQIYLSCLPKILLAAGEVAQEAGISEYIDPVCHAGIELYLQPLAGEDTPLHRAYRMHRFMEEMNDLYLQHAGHPLIPVDNLRSNLIVYQLLGDTCASQLDLMAQSVLAQVNGSIPQEYSPAFLAYLEGRSALQNRALLERWPCLIAPLAIHLVLGEPREGH